MIVTVCADKGSPGVTWTSVVLSMVWPGERVLVEADVSGGDLALRLKTPAGTFLPRQPTVRGLSVDARSGTLPSLLPYAVDTSLSFPVIPATDMGSEAFRVVARHWQAVASSIDQWPGTAVADVGRLQEDTASGPIAAASKVVLLIGRPSPEGLHQLGERARALATRLGQEPHGTSLLTVALVCRRREREQRLDELRRQLAADPVTADVKVAGSIADDPQAIELLRRGVLTKKVTTSDLLESASEVVETLLTWSPELRVTATRLSVEPWNDFPALESTSSMQWGPTGAVDLNRHSSTPLVGGWQ